MHSNIRKGVDWNVHLSEKLNLAYMCLLILHLFINRNSDHETMTKMMMLLMMMQRRKRVGSKSENKHVFSWENAVLSIYEYVHVCVCVCEKKRMLWIDFPFIHALIQSLQIGLRMPPGAEEKRTKVY